MCGVCVHVCARMCVCVCACMCVCVHICMCVCECTYVCAHMRVWVRVCVCVCVRVCTLDQWLSHATKWHPLNFMATLNVFLDQWLPHWKLMQKHENSKPFHDCIVEPFHVYGQISLKSSFYDPTPKLTQEYTENQMHTQTTNQRLTKQNLNG